MLRVIYDLIDLLNEGFMKFNPLLLLVTLSTVCPIFLKILSLTPPAQKLLPKAKLIFYVFHELDEIIYQIESTLPIFTLSTAIDTKITYFTIL